MSENTICMILLIFGGLVAIFGYWLLCYIYIKDLEKQQKEKGRTIIDDCGKCIHCWKCIHAFEGGIDCNSFRRRAGIRKRSSKRRKK